MNILMVEKMTAVWLIILTVMVCAAVPGILIWLTTAANTSAKVLAGYFLVGFIYDHLYIWFLI